MRFIFFIKNYISPVTNNPLNLPIAQQTLTFVLQHLSVEAVLLRNRKQLFFSRRDVQLS